MRDTRDVREPPAIDIISLRLSKGAQTDYHDPYVSTLEIADHDEPIRSIELTEEAIHSYDAVVIVTDHTSYDYNWIVDNANLVVDTRNATNKVGDRENIRRL